VGLWAIGSVLAGPRAGEGGAMILAQYPLKPWVLWSSQVVSHPRSGVFVSKCLWQAMTGWNFVYHIFHGPWEDNQTVGAGLSCATIYYVLFVFGKLLVQTFGPREYNISPPLRASIIGKCTGQDEWNTGSSNQIGVFNPAPWSWNKNEGGSGMNTISTGYQTWLNFQLNHRQRVVSVCNHWITCHIFLVFRYRLVTSLHPVSSVYE
jgi:hypothetical protein